MDEIEIFINLFVSECKPDSSTKKLNPWDQFVNSE